MSNQPITLDAVHQMVGSIFENYTAAIGLLKDVAEGKATQGEIIDFLMPLGISIGDAEPGVSAKQESNRTRAMKLLGRTDPINGMAYRDWNNQIRMTLCAVINEMSDEMFDVPLNATDAHPLVSHLLTATMRLAISSTVRGFAVGTQPTHKERAICIALVEALYRELHA